MKESKIFSSGGEAYPYERGFSFKNRNIVKRFYQIRKNNVCAFLAEEFCIALKNIKIISREKKVFVTRVVA